MDFLRLRRVELPGSAQIVGEVPRKGEPSDVLTVADKYANGREFSYDGRHGWLRIVPERIVSWDFANMRR